MRLASAAEPPPALIGGFFELDLGGVGARGGRSVAQAWFGDAQAVAGFRNARSALAYGILPGLRARTLWLPAFLCGCLHATPFAGALRSYPLVRAGTLEPDTTWLTDHLADGDAVLVVDYFGKPPSPAFRAFVASRPDVTWIEDRAQALAPGAPWGDLVLYSPRKLLGVGDGGYAVVPAGRVHRPLRAPVGAAVPGAAWPAFLARFEDRAGASNSAWYSAYRAEERSMQAAAVAASRLTGDLLARIDCDDVAGRRRRNHAALVAALPPGTVLAGYDRATDWAPQGVPVLASDAPSAIAAMARVGVFCTHLWPDLSANPLCQRTGDLRGRLLLLPCDQRYGVDDMNRVAAAFSAHASTKAA